MKILSLAALGIAALAALPASAATWSDTYLGYQYSNQFRDPGVSGNEVKSRIELSGVYGWEYGSNFFDVNMLAASRKDPSQNLAPYGKGPNGISGDTEVYVAYRTTLDLGKVFKTNMAFGPVRAVEFTAGFDFDSTNNAFASDKKYIMAGPQVSFNISKGFWNLGVGLGREYNYNGFDAQDVTFRTAPILFTAWSKSFDCGIPLVWKGWGNFIGSKGNQRPGIADAPTKPETIADTYLLADISKLFGHKPGAVFIGPGFEFWNNKFGAPNLTDYANTNGDNNQPVHALMFAAEFHF